MTASPDGCERPVIGNNGQWPIPAIEVGLDNRLVVEITNGLESQVYKSTSTLARFSAESN